MAIVSLLGTKGGCGVSLLAANLGVALAVKESCLLIDLNPLLGSDDLLLDLPIEKSWFDMLPVGGELTQHHLDLATACHSSGLRLLGAPEQRGGRVKQGDLVRLLKGLRELFAWTLLDVPAMNLDVSPAAFSATDFLILVSTVDPQPLRSLKRLVAGLPHEFREKTGLVFNQALQGHPALPKATAASLGLPLLAVLPFDPRGVGMQVNFGYPCVADARSTYGRAVKQLAFRLVDIETRIRTEQATAREGELEEVA